MQNKTCLLCNNKSKFIYKLNNLNILQCQNCKSCFTEDMPDAETLKKYYDGFHLTIAGTNKPKNLGPAFQKWFAGFNLPQNAKMLDIGGGRGEYSLAFEKFGFGQATYIDLDKQACANVATIGITHTINDDICNLAQHTKDKYDFIYSRHLIEHLPDPRPLIDAAIELLSDNGIFILQCPNGLSFECLNDKPYCHKRKEQLKASNDFSTFKIFRLMHSSKIASGIDPIRHLWAISPKGLADYLKTKNISYKIETHSIKDKVYSPGHAGKKSLAHCLLSIPHGSSHLVAKIWKNKE